jgi:trehalose 6-phosphate phosphatase
MTYLLSEEGRWALRTLTDKPILYAFDFDGTLAPISKERDTVKVSNSVLESLKALAQRAPCAVISGRALADLELRVGRTIPYLIGNHGLESPCIATTTLTWAENVCARWMKQVRTHFVQPLKDWGVEIEHKRYSLTFHYRDTGDPTKVCEALLLLLHQLSPAPRVIGGKASVNVLPPGKEGKGQAALALMIHLRQAGLFFIGDDETDEDVFGLSEGLTMGARVGRRAESRAQYYIKDQKETVEVIRFLVHLMDQGAMDRKTSIHEP